MFFSQNSNQRSRRQQKSSRLQSKKQLWIGKVSCFSFQNLDLYPFSTFFTTVMILLLSLKIDETFWSKSRSKYSCRLCLYIHIYYHLVLVNLCQKLLFLNQLTHTMMTDWSLFMKIVSSEYLQNMLCTQLLFLFCFDIQNNFGTQHVLQMLRASEKDLPVRCWSFEMKWQAKLYKLL